MNCNVACLQPHIDNFTKLATYSASVVKSNFGNVGGINSFYQVEYARHTGDFTFSVAGLHFLRTFSRSVFSAFAPSGSGSRAHGRPDETERLCRVHDMHSREKPNSITLAGSKLIRSWFGAEIWPII